MLTFLAFLGKLSWPVLGSLVPGLNPKLIMWVAGFLAVLVAVGGPAGAVWIHMHGVKREAVRSADARCTLSKAEDARISAETMAHLLDKIAKADAEEPKTAAEEKALCAKSKLCRKAE